jgi:hypothetical protein
MVTHHNEVPALRIRPGWGVVRGFKDLFQIIIAYRFWLILTNAPSGSNSFKHVHDYPPLVV